jgi:NAD(P)H-hydrate repair Nnr-like enzyme with NAD(P)H-hydrate dehydratase domain
LFADIAGRPGGATILTPHQGEFSRLFSKIDDDANVSGKLEQGRQAARASGAVVLLKGADTVVAAPDGRASVADNAPAFLATAGAGDVLAGLLAGLGLHGEAAREFGPGLIAEDLSEALPAVYRRLFAKLENRRHSS